MTLRHTRLMALDIETVPDTNLIPPGFTDFPKVCWHRVACISFLEAEIAPRRGGSAFLVESCRSGGDGSYDEAMLLRSFWSYFAERRPRLVTWNGRAFDVAVLRFRAMMHGVATQAWSRSDGREGYENRYSSAWHCDLMDQISGYGASPKLRLQDASRALGFPGKISEGGGVLENVKAGRLDRVRAYCEIDTVLTYGVYLHWARTQGLSDASAFSEGEEALATYLAASRADRPHLGQFMDGWRRSSTPQSVPLDANRRPPDGDAAPSSPLVRTAGTVRRLGGPVRIPPPAPIADAGKASTGR